MRTVTVSFKSGDPALTIHDIRDDPVEAMMARDEWLVDEGAVRILLADEYEHLGPYTDEQVEWAYQALGIGKELTHYGDCTKVALTCRLCLRTEYQRKMRAAMAAIDASGVAWVAPWETPAPRFELMWAAWRDTYLAQQKEEGNHHEVPR